jgi:hypothetical protein
MNTRTAFLCVLSLGALSSYILWQGHERRRMVEELRGPDRLAVYESTLTGFKKLCVDRAGGGEGFEKYCDTQRDFLELFRECDTGCVRLLAKAEQGPTR